MTQVTILAPKHDHQNSYKKRETTMTSMRKGGLGFCAEMLGLMVMVVLATGLTVLPARAQDAQRQQYGGNFAWSYSTPNTTYYNGPAFNFYAPYGLYPSPYPYYGYGGGGNVQYFRRGRNAFAVETYRDENGRIQQRTGFFHYGGR